MFILERLSFNLSLLPCPPLLLLDCKRGDIGSTAEAYADAMFDVYRGEAVTVSPYMGKESIRPFMSWRGRMEGEGGRKEEKREGGKGGGGKGVFVLCRTSNKEASHVQAYGAGQGSRLFLDVVGELCEELVSEGGCIGLVVGATDCQALREVRRSGEGWRGGEGHI